MEITLFFLLFFSSLCLAYYYYAHQVIYLGVLSALIILLLGVTLAATGSLEQIYCFSDRVNETEDTADNFTTYGYSVSCHTETLTLSRDFINLLGALMMFIGAGMIIDFGITLKGKEKEER